MQSNPVWRWLVIFQLVAAGCATPSPELDDHFSRKINPAKGAVESVSAAHAVVKDDGNRRALADRPSRPKDPVMQTSAVIEDRHPASAAVSEAAAADPATVHPSSAGYDPSGIVDQDRLHAGELTLPGAIELSFRRQPRLRVFLESIEQARGHSDIAFSPFLPTLSGGIGGGGVFLNVDGQSPNGFSFLLPGATVPIGLNLQSGFGVADIRMQWLIYDFGRRAGRYNQAEFGLEIAQLQTQRAYQTIANEVTVAYYQVLRAQSMRRISEEAVRRADDDLGVAKNLQKEGAIEREKVLRAEVQLAQSQRLLDTAEGGTAISVAALNLAIGIDVGSPTNVVAVGDIPPFPSSLSECLQTAVQQRRELGVAHRGVQVACEGQRVAKADFAPKIVADAAYLNLQQATPQSNLNLGLGSIKLEWGLFEGGRRVGELRVADSKMRTAMALAESITDTINFQITEAYQQMVTARKGIDRAQPAVDQARENYRLVKARAAQGDATPADMTDAETAFIRAEQDHATSIYDYLTALARLEFAMGVSPAPGSFESAD